METTAVAGLNLSLTDVACGYFRSRALCAAARLGIADALGDGERTVADLASACQADGAGLYRLLRALASFGVVAETQPGSFLLTDYGRPLRKDHPESEWPSVVFWADLLADAWSDLTACVRTGKPSREVRPPEVPALWSQDPQAGEIFRAVMGTSPAENYMPIARAWDFSRFGVIADLGGGGGALIEAVLQANPAARGMLVDREPSIEQARPRFARPELAGRCRLIAADLAKNVPTGANVYMLKHVLHAYDDARAGGILGHCRAVMAPADRLLIIEFVLPDVIDHADAALEARLMSDLNMLAVTGGRERSAREWRELLDAAGFTCLAVHPVEGDLVSIVEAQPRS
jgi:hypothetical protein